MNLALFLDIIVLGLGVLSLVFGIIKGGFKMLSKYGAIIASAITVRLVLAFLGLPLIANILLTILLFIGLYIAYRIVFGRIAKILSNVTGLGLVDKILGAVLGLASAFTIAFILSLLLKVGIFVEGFILKSDSLMSAVAETKVFGRIFF